MYIRKANYKDLHEIEEIFVYARAFMKANGNPNQWKDDRPAMSAVKTDIDNGNFYIVEEGDQIVGCFAFIIGDDATYSVIENGSWLDNAPYGTIHRIANNGRTQGMMGEVLDFCNQKIGNIRIDTHADNKVMRHLLEKNNFEYCGIIYTDDGTKRLAFQRHS